MKKNATKKLTGMNQSLAEAIVLKKLKQNNMIERVKSKVYKDLILDELEKIKSKTSKREKIKDNQELPISLEIVNQVQENLSEIKEMKKVIDELKAKIQVLFEDF